ncbi:MAG: 4Fe-4S ferredoxin [Candidatus Bathyarchaeia archaeon]
MKLLETWVKAPFLKGAFLLLAGECVQGVYPDLYKRFVEGRTVLTSCPEAESVGSIMGKLASIIACSNPREIRILTVDGSPHCFALHAALNQALFVTGSSVPSQHFVVVDGKAVEVSPESVRVGRYLHLVQKCVENYPQILDELVHCSLEHCCFRKKE